MPSALVLFHASPVMSAERWKEMGFPGVLEGTQLEWPIVSVLTDLLFGSEHRS